MRRYLATLHKRPDDHKRRFALAVSGSFTLVLFAFWSMATFGAGGVLAHDSSKEAREASRIVSPLGWAKSSLASSWAALSGGLAGLEEALGGVDFEADYEEMKGGALNVYGR